MKILLIMLMLVMTVDAEAQQTSKPRVLISTDIGGTDPDDNQSLAHLLMYSEMFDLEGLVSSPSFGDGSTSEIFRMIDVYEQDLPKLKKHVKGLMKPKALRKLVKQGRTEELSPCGYGKSTEGSEWIVKQARKNDPRPLYVLVWGCLEDVAQALHDAPDIADKIRVYWIGGPNKKWGVNGYCYIIEHFPNLWMIENNTTYRAFIYDSKNRDKYNKGFFETFIKSSGNCEVQYARMSPSTLPASPSTSASSSGKATTRATVSMSFAIPLTTPAPSTIPSLPPSKALRPSQTRLPLRTHGMFLPRIPTTRLVRSGGLTAMPQPIIGIIALVRATSSSSAKKSWKTGANGGCG